MKNTEINNIYFRNNGASALYCGSALIWKKGSEEQDPDNYIPKYNFSGKFTDDSTEEDWWYILVDNGNNNNKLYLNVNAETKVFDTDESEIFLTFKDKYNRLFTRLFNNNNKLLELYHIPFNSGVNTTVDMFNNCSSLQSVNCKDWNTENVTIMDNMFNNCSSLQSLDFADWNVEKVTSMINMFNNCSSLQSVNCKDWNTENVTSMISMFNNCSSLQSLDFADWNVEKVTSMSNMFNNCSSLQSLNVAGWNVEKVTSMSNMFGNCKSLTTIKGPIYNIKTDLSFKNSSSYCPLTIESIMVIFNGLAEVEETKTVTFHRKVYDTLTPEQIALATAKGWSVVRS